MDERSLDILFSHHPRHWRENAYVYPVVSRRSRGVSIGVNLNPDAACNFDCIYCQVDRRTTPAVRRVDLDRLRTELELMLEAKEALEEMIRLGRELKEPTVEARAELAALKDQIRLLKEKP